jgi:hypothetical protein
MITVPGALTTPTAHDRPGTRSAPADQHHTDTGDTTMTSNLAAADARRRARYYAAETIRAERAGRHADAAALRAHADAARRTAARRASEVIA